MLCVTSGTHPAPQATLATRLSAQQPAPPPALYRWYVVVAAVAHTRAGGMLYTPFRGGFEPTPGTGY
jgi:hypothetical protein